MPRSAIDSSAYKRNKGVDIPLSLQPFHNPRQFCAKPRSLGVVVVRNGIRQKAFEFLDNAIHLLDSSQRHLHSKVSLRHHCGFLDFFKTPHNVGLLFLCKLSIYIREAEPSHYMNRLF